jgi:hypothetical protein
VKLAGLDDDAYFNYLCRLVSSFAVIEQILSFAEWSSASLSLYSATVVHLRHRGEDAWTRSLIVLW